MDSLIKNLLGIRATDHRKIQEEIKRNLEKFKNETIKILVSILCPSGDENG